MRGGNQKMPEGDPIAHILKENIAVWLTPDTFQFCCLVKGKRYGAPSLKGLETLVIKAMSDTAFSPDKLQLESLNSAKKVITGKYEDHLRTGHVDISIVETEYWEEGCKGLYKLSVHVRANGKQDSREFQEESDRLCAAIEAEVVARMQGAEWAVRDTIKTTSYWFNPAAVTRVEKLELKRLILDYLPTVLECQSLADKPSIRLGEEENQDLILKLRNGQCFEIEIRERSRK